VLENATVADGRKSTDFLQGLTSETGTYSRPNQILRAIRSAKGTKDLLRVNNGMIDLSEEALRLGGTGSLVNHIVSSCHDAMTCRMAEIVLAQLEAERRLPHYRFALLATGGFGRSEMSVESDQDTLLVLDDNVDEGGRECSTAAGAT
jgi:CBS domain-containing protein